MRKIRLKKNFWRNMMVMNCTLIAAICILFTVIRYNTSIAVEKENVENLLQQIAEANTNQFRLLIEDLDRLSLNIAISNITQTVLKEANSYTGNDNFFDVHRTQRRELIQMMQQTVGAYMRDTSVNIISSKGDYVLLDVYDSVMLNREEMQSRYKMPEFDETQKFKFISPISEDAYGRTDTPMFSFIRKISDEFGDYGYIEIQKAQSRLDTIFNNSKDSFDIASILTMNDTLFYTSDPNPAERSEFSSDPGPYDDMQEISHITLGHNSFLVYSSELREYGFKLYTLMDESYYTQRIFQEALILILQGVILLASMLALILVLSRQVYRPVRELRHRMEHAELDNIQFGAPPSKDADEIEMFNYVFTNMITRIRHQNDELIEQRMRELQVSYNALQAQVNPHFLYNTLYLIGLKGAEHDVQEIMDMCSYLTHMMAYCIDSQKNMVPFSSEIEYMENYLQLMKCRYLDKLDYQLDIADGIARLQVPKFILQPLVENCFAHGFKNCSEPRFIIRLSIHMQDDMWVLRIEDNGNGFSKEDTDRVYQEVAFVQKSIQNPNAKFIDEITGIGLTNTYARLLICFPEKVQLLIGHSSMQGGLVEITCASHTER